MPTIMTGMAMPAISEITTGAPSNIPTCHRTFRVCDHGFFPQKVQPEGLWKIQSKDVKSKTQCQVFNTPNLRYRNISLSNIPDYTKMHYIFSITALLV